MDEEIQHRIALMQLPGIGSLYAQLLTDYFKSAKRLFKANKSELEIVPGIGPVLLSTLSNNKIKQDALNRAAHEMDFIAKNNIKVICHDSSTYSNNLKLCEDGPYLLFGMGNFNPNPLKSLAIVGTRKSTPYGEDITHKIIEDLKGINVTVFSGLAYGIDIIAHKRCVEKKLPTVGVLAHGLDNLYPNGHRNIAKNMLENGGLLTEFISKTNPDRENFPKRNRIVAGLADATIVVEAAEKGGALITANIAHSYNRDVFAVPGRSIDTYSLGCNKLIKNQKAVMVESGKDILELMGWIEKEFKNKPMHQTTLFQNHSPEQNIILEFISKNGKVNKELIALKMGISLNKISGLLFELELDGSIKNMPGNTYQLKVH